jgi:N-acetylglucosamine malate deacetylase 1
MNLDVLAIAAHPDDVELTCGGTLIKMSGMGYRTGILDLTRGEMGTRGSPEIREQEATAAGKVMGLALRANAGLPDSRLEVKEEYKRVIAVKIRELRPRTVILPHWEGRHPDHYNASKLGYEACFIAGLKQYPLEGEPFRPFKILYSAAYSTLTPNFATDITEQYARRREAILCYRSQFQPPNQDDGRAAQQNPRVDGRNSESESEKVFMPLDRLEAEMNLVASYYGRMIGVQYAEGFTVRETQQVDDIVKMGVRSI